MEHQKQNYVFLAGKKNWSEPVDRCPFWLQYVNGVGPIEGYQLYHGTGTVHNSSVRPVIHNELVGLRVRWFCSTATFLLMKCKQVHEGSQGHATSILYWNAFKSLNLNELPMDIVYGQIREGVIPKLISDLCSPAQCHLPRRAHVGFCIWFGELRGEVT